LFSLFSRLKKFFLHLLTGKSEIERILSKKRTKQTTIDLGLKEFNFYQESSIKKSKQIHIFDYFNSMELLINEIVKVKQLKRFNQSLIDSKV
jgi:hypothetical protein